MVKFFLKLFSMMPLKLNHLIGTLIGRLLYLTNSQSKHVVRKNIEICFPNLSKAQQQDLVKESLIESGKGLSESGFVWFNSFEYNAKHIVKTKGAQHLKGNENTILLVPHFGCWEIAARVVSLHRPTTFMYKELNDKKQNALLLSLRQQQDLHMVAANKKGVLKLQRALKDKQLIAILPDQYPGEKGSVVSSFFKQDTRTMTLLVKLARNNNAKVLMTWADRLDNGKGYELNVKPVNILSSTGMVDDDVALMNQAIEQLVKTKPEQYLWNYKRFKGIIRY
ncbi:lysophospholipid acyltransferase family protein [thiotrophic endosymbiont of Bathymodiolus puteoserpentis (Logatchev)]|uniref:lysophospholipid acyltransferase family protein n=1 Tax=thiotrophic endosymbiont of Bathymodiolus puteoserpentis (Logatchev) TaxID=343240 RepID=UPI0010AF3AF2|nr:lysophospholipid acyltransferase family protein [thiotrophic endosymbiont of Bathymodiolus puteoserpentis (Logatchev)]SSC09577.1 Lipid A biosynthesis lauroyl acyltransferase [thiotrophic endosymbiont of Bathymodiolus puteoserpentis (Logatchev)]